jgi:hypothetical protein
MYALLGHDPEVSACPCQQIHTLSPLVHDPAQMTTFQLLI